MTGEEVIRGAVLIERWRKLHRIKTHLFADGLELSDLTALIWSEPEICAAVLSASTVAAGQKLDEMIQSVHSEARELGITAPFPAEVAA